MEPRDDLFQLIKSLSPNEKRYFRLHSKFHDTNHIRLFDAVNSQHRYDECAIKEKLKNENFISQLTFTKLYLYNEIIDNLIPYHKKSSSETGLLYMILELRLLFKKGLFKQYFRKLETARKKAWQYEKFYILLELLRLTRLVMDTKKYRVYDPEVVYKEEEIVLKKIQNLSQYSRLFNKVQRLKRQIGVSSSEIGFIRVNELLHDPLLKDPAKAMSAQALEYFYHILQVLYSLKGDIRKQRQACINRLNVIEKDLKPFLDDIVNVRKEALYTLIEISIYTKDKTSFKTYIKKYYSLSGKTSGSKIDYEIVSNFMNLMYMVSTGNYENERSIINNAKSDLTRYRGKLYRDMELESMFLLVKYYFLRENFDEALNNINELLDHPVIKYRRDIFTYSKIMNLLIHFKLGNHSLSEYLVDSLKKTLKTEKNIYQREMAAVELIDRILKGASPFPDKYEKYSNNKAVPVYYFDALNWIQNHIKP